MVFGGTLLFLLLTVVVGMAVSDPQQGSTAPGAHEYRDLVTQGDAACAQCHFPSHNEHADLNTCSDCHAPKPGEHAARPASCIDCHDVQADVSSTTTVLPPGTTTTAPVSSTTTVLPPGTTTTAPVSSTTTVLPPGTTTTAP